MNGCNRICTNGKQMVFLRHDSSYEFVSWRIGCNWMCINGKQMAFRQYESSCEFASWHMTLHENYTYGRREVSCPIWRYFFDTETILGIPHWERSLIITNIFLPFFSKHFQEKNNWIVDTFIYQIFWKRQLYFGFDLVDFSLMPF